MDRESNSNYRYNKNMSKICQNCQSENPDNALFCHDCGDEFACAVPDKIDILDNRYEIRETVKKGKLGCVYKVWDTRLNTFAAVKKIMAEDPKDSPNEAQAKKFKQEASVLSSLHHEGLPFIIDFFTDRDIETRKQAYYLIMTWIDGKNLNEIIRENNHRPFALEEAVDIFLQLVEILDYLHTRTPPIIFGEISPSSVMISAGRVFLVDFGITKLLNEGKKGVFSGVPGYMAPEQCNGHADERSDIFSLGALIHQLLSGRKPGEMTFTFERISNINRQVPPYLDEILMRMLSLFSDQRPKNMEVIRERYRQKTNETTLQDQSEKAMMFCDRGNAYAQQEQYAKAINEYNEAIKTHPGFIRAYINRGSMFYKLKNFDSAIADYNKALQLDHNTAKAYFNRGAAYYAKNMLLNALKDFETVVKLDPADTTAGKYLEIIRSEMK
ncbi:MAG: tetratricopeptide repeat protein [Firmicutes bacterium]|nr:tetratricopeptide repeat protein [Bacillota bacterium]